MIKVKNIDAPEFSRNFGFWSKDEQEAIINTRVAIAGVGGDGYQLGVKLARMGVASFDVADPEVFEPENANRVPGASHSTYGLPKAEVFASHVRDINPDAELRIFKEGVTSDNAEEFVGKADLLFDESELTHLEIGVSLARAARERKIPTVMVMNIGYSALVTSFHPESRHTFEKFMGIPKGMPIDEVRDEKVDFSRCLPYIPAYGDLNTLIAVQNGASLPSISQGVDIASGIGASQGFLHMVRDVRNKRPDPIWSPRIAYVDSYNFKSGITRYPRVSHYRHLAKMATRHYLGLNPRASYSNNELSD